MRRTIDMIRSSSVSATVMQAAARGALAVPGVEMIEILVYLANHNKVFGQQARMTLAGWELKSSLEAASNPATPQEVLDYLIAAENLRPPLLPALLDNPSVTAKTILATAGSGSSTARAKSFGTSSAGLCGRLARCRILPNVNMRRRNCGRRVSGCVPWRHTCNRCGRRKGAG